MILSLVHFVASFLYLIAILAVLFLIVSGRNPRLRLKLAVFCCAAAVTGLVIDLAEADFVDASVSMVKAVAALMIAAFTVRLIDSMPKPKPAPMKVPAATANALAAVEPVPSLTADDREWLREQLRFAAGDFTPETDGQRRSRRLIEAHNVLNAAGLKPISAARKAEACTTIADLIESGESAEQCRDEIAEWRAKAAKYRGGRRP